MNVRITGAKIVAEVGLLRLEKANILRVHLVSHNGCIADVAACVGIVGWDLAAICSNALLAAFFHFLLNLTNAHIDFWRRR